VALCGILLGALPGLAQVNTERFRQDAESTGFSGNADLEGTVITGNADLQFYSIAGRLNYNWGPAYTFLIVDSGIGWENGNRLFNQSLAQLRHVQTMNTWLQLEGFLQHDVNKKRKLLGRQLIGGGVRLRLLKAGPLKLRNGIAYMYEMEEYDLPASSLHGRDVHAHRLSTYLTLEVGLQKTLKVLSVTYLQPEIGDWRDFKLVTENALIIDAGKHLDVSLKMNGRYDSRPPETIKKLDTISKMGLSLKF